MTDFWASLLFAYLPRQWWGKWRPASTVQLRYAAVASGFLESLIILPPLLVRYGRWMSAVPEEMAGDPRLSVGAFMLYTMTFMVQPVTVLLLLFLVEGAVRALAAAMMDEIVPSIPLAITAKLGRKWESTAQRRPSAPAFIDIFEQTGDEVRIMCSQPKGDWHRSVTIAIRDEFFDIAEEKTVTGSHPRVYLLTRHPANAVIRAMRRYDPPDSLKD